jgi:hypothetical protein
MYLGRQWAYNESEIMKGNEIIVVMLHEIIENWNCYHVPKTLLY